MLKPFPQNICTPVELGEEYSYPCNYACTPVTSMEVTSSVPVRPNLDWTIGKAANMTCYVLQYAWSLLLHTPTQTWSMDIVVRVDDYLLVQVLPPFLVSVYQQLRSGDLGRSLLCLCIVEVVSILMQ